LFKLKPVDRGKSTDTSFSSFPVHPSPYVHNQLGRIVPKIPFKFTTCRRAASVACPCKVCDFKCILLYLSTSSESQASKFKITHLNHHWCYRRMWPSGFPPHFHLRLEYDPKNALLASILQTAGLPTKITLSSNTRIWELGE
jgi:hypothetical protein